MDAISTPNCLCCGAASSDYLEHLLEEHNFNLARAREVISKGKREENAIVVNENSSTSKTIADSNVLNVGGVPITLPKDGSTNGHVYNIHLNFGGSVAGRGDKPNRSNVNLTTSLPASSTASNQSAPFTGSFLPNLPVDNSFSTPVACSDPNPQVIAESNNDNDILFIDKVIDKKNDRSIMQPTSYLGKVEKGGHGRKLHSDKGSASCNQHHIAPKCHKHQKSSCKTCNYEDSKRNGKRRIKMAKRKLRVKAPPERECISDLQNTTKEPAIVAPVEKDDDDKKELNEVELVLKHGKLNFLERGGGLHKCKICGEEFHNTKKDINNHVTSRHDINAIQYQALYFEKSSLWHKVRVYCTCIVFS